VTSLRVLWEFSLNRVRLLFLSLVCVCVAKASAKRFRVTGRGKIVRRCAGKQHLLGKKNTKRKKRLSKMVCFCSSPPL